MLQHSVIVENRQKIIIQGVKDVESFNENEAIVITTLNALRIRGKALEVSQMNIESGHLEMTGEITALNYSDSDRTPNNIITKLFK